MNKKELLKLINRYVDDEEIVVEVMIREYVRIDSRTNYEYDKNKIKMISRYFKYNETLEMWMFDDVKVDIIQF